MDVLSLPDEMLASVLKFSKFETITRLRKTNTRINIVIQRYGLSKPKIYHIVAMKNSLWVGYRIAEIYDRRPGKYMESKKVIDYISLPCTDVHLMFEKKLQEVRKIEEIIIDTFDIDSKWLNLLHNIKQQFRNDLYFVNCNYYVSVEDLIKVTSKFKRSLFEITPHNIFLQEPFASDKVIRSLLPHADISCQPSNKNLFYRLLTNETLKNLDLSHPTYLHIGKHITNFTVRQVIQTIKTILEYCGGPFREWNLGIVFARTQRQFRWATEKLKSTKGVKIIEARKQVNALIRTKYCICRVRIVDVFQGINNQQ